MSRNTKQTGNETPAQNKLQEEIIKQTKFVLKLTEMRNARLTIDEAQRQLEETTKNQKSNKQKLNRLIGNATRLRKKKKWKNWFLICQRRVIRVNTKRVKQFTNKRPGWPALEDSSPYLHKAIAAIATADSGANFWRRTKNLNAFLTLDDVRDCLIKDGYEQICFVPEISTNTSRFRSTKKTCKNCSCKE